MKKTIKSLALAGFATLAVLGALPTSAATVTWTGASGGDWNTPGNWSGSALPLAADTALFNSTLAAVTNASADQTVSNINFDTSAGTASGSFTLGTTGGNKFTLKTNGIVQILSTLTGTGKSIVVNAPLTLLTNTFQNNVSDSSDTLSFGGPLTQSAAGLLTIQGSNAGTNTISGTISSGNNLLTITKNSSGTWIISSGITNLSALNVYGGNLILNNDANSFTPEPAIIGGATLTVTSLRNTGTASALGAPSSTTITMGSGTAGGTINYIGSGDTCNRQIKIGNAGTAGSLAALILNNGANGGSGLRWTAATLNTVVSSSTNSRTLTLGGTNTDANLIQGAIVDNTASTGLVGLTKTNSGTWIVSGVNTYTGPTLIYGGTLLVMTNSLAAGSAVTVDGTAGGTLGGSGTINGTVTLQNGGTLQPSLSGSTNTLTLANATSPTFNAGSKLKIRVPATTTADKIALPNATVNVNNLSLTIDTTGLSGNATGLTIVSATNVSGTFASTNIIGNANYIATVHYNGSTITLDLTSTILTVSYNNNGGTGSQTDGNTYVNGNTVTVLGQGTIAKTGYSFTGWNTQAGGGGTAYTWNGSVFSPATFTMGSTAVTLYAQWSINSYTLTYNGNGSDGGTLPSPVTQNYNTTTTVAAAGVTLTNYAFTGWNTAANGSGTPYAVSATFTFTANTTLYAQWLDTRIGFNQTGAGPYDYNNTANWFNGVIDGTWNPTLNVGVTQTVTFAAATLLTNGLTIDYTGDSPLILKAAVAGTQSVTLGGDISYDVTAATANGTTNSVTIGDAANHLNVNLGGVNRNITITSQTNTLNLLDTVSNGGITTLGAGTLVLAGNNTYAGVTTVSNGMVLIENNNALGTTAGNTILNCNGSVTTGGALMLSNNIVTPENITVQGSYGSPYVASIANAPYSTNTINGNITLSGTGAMNLQAQAYSALTVNGTIARDGAAGNYQFNVDTNSTIVLNNSMNLNGTSGTGNFTIKGALGTLTAAGQVVRLSAAGNSIGTSQVRSCATLRIGANDVLNTNSTLTVGVFGGGVGDDIATFDLGGYNQTVSSLYLSPANTSYTGNASTDDHRIVTNSAASGTSTLTIGNNNTASAVYGQIVDGANAKVALTKIGTSYATLYGANTYSGPTTISGGKLTLAAGGSAGIASLSANTTLNIAAGGTFVVVDPTVGNATYAFTPASLNASGTGNAAGTTAAAIQGSVGGTVDLGATPITLTWTGPSSGNNYTNQPLLVVSSTLNLNNNQFTVVVPGAALTNGTYNLVYAPNITGTVNPSPLYTGGNGVAPSCAGTISINGANNVVLTVAASGPTGSATITNSIVNGNQLVLDWPAGQGWLLQSNSVNLADTNSWFNVTGATPPFTNTINPTQPEVFYRLKY
jgi:autotransporter-associated beta strand protein